MKKLFAIITIGVALNLGYQFSAFAQADSAAAAAAPQEAPAAVEPETSALTEAEVPKLDVSSNDED